MTDLEKSNAAKLERLRALIEEGLASGSEPMAPDEFERIEREGRALLAARKKSRESDADR